MEALKKMYETLHFEHVQTYIQSGNVVFQYKKSEQSELEQKISTQIKKQFGFDVPLFVMSIEDLRAIIKNNPFVSDSSKDITFLHVSFLSSPPVNAEEESIRQKQAEGEAFYITDKAVYLYCPKGYGRTKLHNTFFEKKLNVGVTTRNWKTTKELLSMAEKTII